MNRIAAIVTAITLTATAVPAHAADKMKITVSGWFSTFSGYFLAIDKGYYAQEGIETEIIQAGGGTATPALLSGDVQYSSSASVAITAILKGGELKIVFADNDRAPYQLWTAQPAIKTLADLKGKQIAIENRGDTHELTVLETFRAEHVDPSTIVFTPLQSRATIIAALSSGSLAAASIITDEAERVKNLPNARMIADMTKIVHTINGGGVFSDAFISKNRDLAKRFMRASMKGRRHAVALPEDMVVSVLKRDSGQNHDAIMQGWVAQEPLRTADGTISLDAQKEEITVRSELLNVPSEKRRTPDQTFDFSIIREANADLDKQGWKP